MSSLSCFNSSSMGDAKSISREIERQLKEAKKEARTQVKLLVLGTAESGKSTFIKQMRIIHGKGYSLDEKRSYVISIFQNINMSLKTLATAMRNFGMEYEHEENQNLGENFAMMTREEEDEIFGSSKVDEIIQFWTDSGVQECYLRGNEFHLFDSCAYYLNDLSRIASEGYLPTLQDILRARLPTLGIKEYLFNIDSFIVGIVDVGGQKTERRKWIHCFENVTSIIFLAALSEYDQSIPETEIAQDLRSSLNNLRLNNFENNNGHSSPYQQGSQRKAKPMSRSHSDYSSKKNNESSKAHLAAQRYTTKRNHASFHISPKGKGGDVLPPFPVIKRDKEYERRYSGDIVSTADCPTVNRLRESCALFKIIVNGQWFANTSVILFLNKTDILEEKVKHSAISDHFSDFAGKDDNVEDVKEYILKKYTECFDRIKHTKRTLYAHYTCATDTNNIRFVFAAIKDIILQSYLMNYNLV